MTYTEEKCLAEANASLSASRSTFVASRVSRAFIKCNCGSFADAEYKINGVGSSLYLCDECYNNGGDLDGHELLEFISRTQL